LGLAYHEDWGKEASVVRAKRAVRKPAKAVRLRLKFTVIVEPDSGSLHAFCPAFKGLHVDGKTENEALRNATKAARVYVDSLAAHGEPLPIGPDCTLDREEQIPTVPPGAFLRHLELQWPSHSTSGIS
jgi:predicted RNase H-like HicB family nuclease